MKNIETVLSEFGIEIPSDKKDAFNKEFHENYKTIAEFNNLSARVDAEKAKATAAEEALKKYDGVDPEAKQREIDEWKAKAEKAEAEYTAKLAEMERDEALETGLRKYKFSSNSAREAIASKVRSANLTLKDKSLLGMDDLIAKFKEEDARAFASEEENAKPKFTDVSTQGGGKKMSTEDIMAITDREKRLKAIADNPELFGIE